MDVQSIEGPIIDYVQGWYNKDPIRISAGLHPLLVKRSPDSSADGGVRNVDLETLRSVTEEYGGSETGRKEMDITVFSVNEGIASAMVVSDSFTDYLHLIKISGKWQIINVLWDYR